MVSKLSFALWLIPPVYYCGALTLHIVRHFNDGVSVSRDVSRKTRTFKVGLCLLQALLCLCYFTLLPFPVDMGLYALAWVESAYIVVFDYNRSIGASWLRQRSFWLFSTVLSLLYLPLSLSPAAPVYHLPLSLCQTLVSFTLSAYALVKPNDYILQSQSHQMMEMLLKGPQEVSKQSSMSLPESQLLVSLSACKVKRVKMNMQLDYRFVVSVHGNPHQLKLSNDDLVLFDQSMRAKFNPAAYPYLDLPTLPKDPSLDIDEHAKKVETYITSFCRPEYRCKELFDFLKIDEKDRNGLDAPLVKFIDMYESVSLSSRSSSDSNGSVLPTMDESLATYFFCRIEGWSKVEQPIPHIVYHVHWSTVNYSMSGSVARRFSDFYQLHRTVKALIGSGKMPDFPSKNYLQSLIGELDSRALDMRKKALERYLCYVLNDPAYCCASLLYFIGCGAPLEGIWAKSGESAPLRLCESLSWFSELDSDGSMFHCYSLVLEQGENRWTIIRRYSEFDQLHTALSNRHNSSLLRAFTSFMSGGEISMLLPLPPLPSKTLGAISTVEEIEDRRKGLERYFVALTQIPFILEAYAFRVFVKGDKELRLSTV